MSQAGSLFLEWIILSIKCSFLHLSFCEESLPWFKSVLTQSVFQQSVGSKVRTRGQRRGSNLNIILQRRIGKTRKWLPGSQTTIRELWLPIPTVKLPIVTASSLFLCALSWTKLTQMVRRTSSSPKGKELQGLQNFLRTWLLPIFFTLQICGFHCIGEQLPGLQSSSCVLLLW